MNKKVEANDEALSSPTTSEINENDVLFGRGKKVHANEGNRRFRLLVWERLPGNAPVNGREQRKSRAAFAKQIVAIVHQRKGRFLKAVESSGDCQWVYVESSAVFTKVKQALRDAEAKQVGKDWKGKRTGSLLGDLDGHVSSPQVSPDTGMSPMGLGTANIRGTDPLLSQYVHHRNELLRRHQLAPTVWAQLQSQSYILEQARQKQVLLLALAGQMQPEQRLMAPLSFQHPQGLRAPLFARSAMFNPLQGLRNDLSVEPSFPLGQRLVHINSAVPPESQDARVEAPIRAEECAKPPYRPQGHADKRIG